MVYKNPTIPMGDSLSNELRKAYSDLFISEEVDSSLTLPSQESEVIPIELYNGAVGIENIILDSSQFALDEVTSIHESEQEKEKREKETKAFIELLKATTFEDGMYNEAYDRFEELRVEMGDSFSEWVAAICRDNFEDDIIVKLLTIFADYDYEELSAVQPWIIMANINNKSNAVKSAVLNIIDSWHNQDALNFLEHFDIPKEPWLKLKYTTIKQDIENVLRA